MIKFRELYEIKNKNTPPDLEKYCDKINKLRKEEKEEYLEKLNNMTDEMESVKNQI